MGPSEQCATFVWVAGEAVVVPDAHVVCVGEEPAGRTVHMTVTGAPARQVPHEDVPGGALHHGNRHHGGEHWGTNGFTSSNEVH